jgi:ribosomal protein S3AE
MAIAKRKKRFFDVDMPIIGKETQLRAYSIEELEGRFIKYDLTRMLRGKSTLMRLKVIVKKEKATADPVEITVLPFFFRRVVRKGTNYIEDSFEAPCKDAVIRIKPLLVSRRKISRAVKRALREKAREEITNTIKTMTKDKLFEDILQGQFQKSLSYVLKKVYPLSSCEIRNIKAEKEIIAKKVDKKE